MADALFTEMFNFARKDVHRAVSTKGLKKSAWQDELIKFGRKKSAEINFAITDHDIELKARWISGKFWYSAAACKPKKTKKGSSWGWKKHIADQGHVVDASSRWSHLKNI